MDKYTVIGLFGVSEKTTTTFPFLMQADRQGQKIDIKRENEESCRFAYEGDDVPPSSGIGRSSTTLERATSFLAGRRKLRTKPEKKRKFLACRWETKL